MTLSTLIQLLGVASMWIRTRAPQFGELIAQKKRSTLDHLFKRVTFFSTAGLFALVTLFCSMLFLMGKVDHEWTAKLANRFLPVPLVIGIAIATLPLHLMQCFATYLRSHKVDPLWRITIASNLLLTLAVVLGEIQFGAIALGASIMIVYGFITLPAVLMAWRKFRAEQSRRKLSSREKN
jgi:membrane-associated HD superfamily phosphohydrolase